MKWLLIAVLILAPQPPKPPESKGAAKSKVAQDAQQSHTSDKKETDSGPTPANVQQIITENPQRDTTESSEDVKIQTRIEVFTGLLVLVGFLQAGVMFLQWCVYRRQARIMAHQAGEMTRQRVTMRSQLEAMEGQLAAMKDTGRQTDELIKQAEKSAESAKKNAEAAVNNTTVLENIERAWLVAKVEPPGGLNELLAGGGVVCGFGFVWTIQNCGRTPGFITRIGARFHSIKAFSELPLEPDVDAAHGYLANEIFAVGVPLGPGDTIRRFRTLEGDAPRSVEEHKRINDGEITYLAYGVIEYKTVLDNEIHKTWFCHRWLPGTGNNFPPSPVPANYTQYT